VHDALSHTHAGIAAAFTRNRSLNSISPFAQCGHGFVSPLRGRVDARRSTNRSGERRDPPMGWQQSYI
jgi:hypothetical protein